MSPQVLHVFEVPPRAAFVNGDARAHDVRSDPHPAHDGNGCTGINVGLLAPGESRMAENLPRGTPCYYHDDVDPSNKAFQGLVLTH